MRLTDFCGVLEQGTSSEALRVFLSKATPYQTANANVLSLTPESAESMIVIGRAKDLGSCQAMKRDGKLCGAWCDT